MARIFPLFLGIFLIGNLLMPAKEYSEAGREKLAGKPKVTWASVWTGTYMEEYEAYQTDQFIGRSVFRSLTSGLGRIAGQREVNGIYYGKQKQLLEEIQSPDEENLQKNLNALWDFAEEHWDVPMSMMIVPDAAQIWKDKMPLFAETSDQAEMVKRVEKSVGELVMSIDVAGSFQEHAGEKLYYQTDYHWTSLGAYYAFQASVEALDIPSEDITDFVSYTVTSDYNGALSARSGYLGGVREEVNIYVPGGRHVEVVVSYPEKEEKRTSVFDSSALEGKDKYKVFLGGDDPVVDIRTTADSDRCILILKDSFANSFVQFLLPYFREIVLVDPQYYEGKAEDLMNTYQITDVLILYRGNTFFTDQYLSGVLSNE